MCGRVILSYLLFFNAARHATGGGKTDALQKLKRGRVYQTSQSTGAVWVSHYVISLSLLINEFQVIPIRYSSHQGYVKLDIMKDMTVERAPGATIKQPGEPYTLAERQAKILQIADMLSEGRRSTKTIMDELKISRPTAIEWRNLALLILADESKPMNREALRNLEIGRLNGLIERLTTKISALEWPDDIKAKEYNITLNTYDKLLGRLKDFGEQLHKITGMNTEINISIEEKRRIVFVRPTKPQTDAQEGEVVEQPTT